MKQVKVIEEDRAYWFEQKVNEFLKEYTILNIETKIENEQYKAIITYEEDK